ncbi:NAD(P)H-flavin reductase [Pleionea sediminis]|uniref:NAD(P)H-flavin reductase n=1 Tax=Pleionea sediminis TaxID=2569479 RepID=UPI001184AC44|nr:NAD(P)H-flavin reductase [Pleionea sediminis]
MEELFCEVKAIDLLGKDVHRVRLHSEALSKVDYQGGQYLTLQADGGRWIPFSIGNAPEEKEFLELHIKLVPGHELAENIMSQLRKTRKAHVQIPMGKCTLRSGKRDVVLIVGGTGFSPAKAIIESAFAKNDSRHFSLFWGAQSAEDLYLDDLPKSWETKESNFTYVPVISGNDSNWNGATGFAHHAAMNHFNNLLEMDFYISGSEAMVMAVYHDLMDKGVPKDQIFADILDIKREMGDDV